ncbi:MAG: STAS domain-containing protein [Planctomycetota bacterium]|jgi:anti-anti-sigma factor
MLDIDFEDAGSVKIAKLRGNLNTGTSPEAQEMIAAEVDKGSHNLVLNLAGVDFVSSSGLRVILATGKKLKKLGGKIVVCELNPTVADVFHISGFDKMFPVADTQANALEEF